MSPSKYKNKEYQIWNESVWVHKVEEYNSISWTSKKLNVTDYWHKTTCDVFDLSVLNWDVLGAKCVVLGHTEADYLVKYY